MIRKGRNVISLRNFALGGDKLDTIKDSELEVEFLDNGLAKVGEKSRRGLCKVINGLKSFHFSILSPREAKCCQSWADGIMDPDDMTENILFNKFNVIKRIHAIFNGLKLLQCFVCHRQIPGFDSPFHNLTMLESGEKLSCVTKDTEKQLRQSKVLGVSVNLNFPFAEGNQCFTEGKFPMEICVD